MRAKGISPLGPGRAQQGAGPSHLLQGCHHPWGPVTLEELFRVGMALTSEVRENAPPQAQQKESGPHQAGGSGGGQMDGAEAERREERQPPDHRLQAFPAHWLQIEESFSLTLKDFDW